MSAFKIAEHSGWTSKAGSYDEHFAVVTRQAIGPMLAAAGPLQGRSLLDVCCGTGDLVAEAVALSAVATGTDFAPTMIEQARSKTAGARFEIGDAEALSFAERSFDAVTCAFGLYHLAEPDKAVAEAARVLRGGGRYVYTGWLPPDRGWDLAALVGRAIATHGSTDVKLPPAPPPFRMTDETVLREVLKSHGFRDITCSAEMAIWRSAHTDDVLDLIAKGTVRTAMLIDNQPTDNRRRIEDDIASGAERLRTTGVITMRWPYLLVSATRV